MGKVVRVLSALAALAMLAACTTSSQTSASTSSPPAPVERTEVIEGSITNLDATSMTVKAYGAFTDTGTLKLPVGNPRAFTFEFTRGNLVVLNATGPISGPLHLNKTTCAFSRSSSGTFRVLAGNSTGSYAGATGHGTYAFNSSGIAPKMPASTCNTSSDVTPAKVLFAITVRGPLLLNQGN